MIALALLLLVVLVCAAAFAGVSGAPWVPAFKRDVDAVINDAKVTAGDVVIELGCGDGRLLAAAAKRGAIPIGYEINPLLWLIAVIRLAGYRGARVYLRNFWRADVSGADVVLAFLVPRTVGRLETKAKAEMKKGSRLVSYVFRLPNLKPKISRHHWFVYYF